MASRGVDARAKCATAMNFLRVLLLLGLLTTLGIRRDEEERLNAFNRRTNFCLLRQW